MDYKSHALTPPFRAMSYGNDIFDDNELGPVSNYPHLNYSMKAVRKAGAKLGQPIFFDEGNYSEAIETFITANSWRDSHFYPMRSINLSVAAHIRFMGLHGDMASRIKRMPSVRRKLKETKTKLDQMNDLGGCRAIMSDINGVNQLMDRLYDRFPHSIRQEYAYIKNPKDDGYRSHHIVYEYAPRNKNAEMFAGRRIELQVRTILQHSWATAVEAVGLYTGEDLKHHKGSPDWLRMFQLMSAEFAETENCPIPQGIPDHYERVRELRDINARSNIVNVLQEIKDATHFAENFRYDAGRFFIIRYKMDHTVTVQTYDSPIVAMSAFGKLELAIEKAEDDSKVVIVEVNRINKLIQTYPNYFGDVSLFVSNLRQIISGRAAIEYTTAALETATEGGGSTKMKSGRKVVYSSSRNRKTGLR